MNRIHQKMRRYSSVFFLLNPATSFMHSRASFGSEIWTPTAQHSRSSRRQLALISESDTAPNSTTLPPIFEKIDDSLSSVLEISTSFASTNPYPSSSPLHAAMHHLLQTVSDIRDKHKNTAARIVSPSEKQAIGLESQDIVEVNSILFCSDNDNKQAVPVLIIVPSIYKVDFHKAARAIGCSNGSLRLVESHLVEEYCGFPPGSVPPVGHTRQLATFVDESLVQQWGIGLIGGGGHPDYSCAIDSQTLVQLEHVQLGDLTKNRKESITNDVLTSSQETRAALQGRPKPFFPVATPTDFEADKCIDYDTSMLPFDNVPVMMLGRVIGVRRLARRLAFVDFAPPDQFYNKNTEQDDILYQWKSGSDRGDMAVQLIIGTALFDTLGEEHTSTVLRRLKPGQLVAIEGQTNLKTLPSVRNWATKRSLDVVISSLQVIDTIPSSDDKGIGILTKMSNKNRQTIAESPSFPLPSDPVSHSVIQLEDIFDSHRITTVDDTDSVLAFSNAISQVLLSLSTSNEGSQSEESTFFNVGEMCVGIDCEWQPSCLLPSSTDPQPVSLFQISVQSLQEIFLVDTHRLLRPLMPPTEPMTELESSVNNILLDLLKSPKLFKVGYQLVSDLRRLAASFPHVPAFQEVNGVIEIANLARMAMQNKKNSRNNAQSLARLTEFFLKKTLCKEQQVSDWEHRPLTDEQIEYGALDAAVTPLLLERILKAMDAGVVACGSSFALARWEGDTSFAKGILSWRFVRIETDDSYVIRKLKAKCIVDNTLIVSQSWITGQLPPVFPSTPTSEGGGTYTDKSGVRRVPAHTVALKEGQDEDYDIAKDSIRKLVGQLTGKSKERCLELLLPSKLASDGVKLDFYPRAGFVEFDDTIALFVNMPDKPGQVRRTNYPNEWLNNGQVLTWYLREGDWEGGESDLARKLLGNHYPPGTLNKNEKESMVESAPAKSAGAPALSSSVVLFVRMGRGEFLSCGYCDVLVPPDQHDTKNNGTERRKWELVQLHLRLLDVERLNESEDFRMLVNVAK